MNEPKMKGSSNLLPQLNRCLEHLQLDVGQNCLCHTRVGDFEIKKINKGYEGGLRGMKSDLIIIDDIDNDRKLNMRSIDLLRLHLL